MTVSEVLALLDAERDERGMSSWASWKTDVYEARVIGLFVDDPARITRDQAEKQVGELAGAREDVMCRRPCRPMGEERRPCTPRVWPVDGCSGDGDRQAERGVERGGSESWRDVGPIAFSSVSGECEPFDVVTHLSTDRLKEKLGV